MKNFIITFGLVGLLCTTLAITPTFAVNSIYRQISCTNGFQGAFSVTQFDDLGCILKIIGLDCDNKAYEWNPTKVAIPNDPGYPYDQTFTGTANGSDWYARVQLNVHGGIAKAWGQDANGHYYEYMVAEE